MQITDYLADGLFKVRTVFMTGGGQNLGGSGALTQLLMG